MGQLIKAGWLERDWVIGVSSFGLFKSWRLLVTFSTRYLGLIANSLNLLPSFLHAVELAIINVIYNVIVCTVGIYTSSESFSVRCTTYL